MNNDQIGQFQECKCKIHPTEDIKAFCKNDLCSICFKCLLGEHRNHDVVMLEDLCVDDLKDKVSLFQDKVEDQIGKLAGIREKVSSIKENYDKKFHDLENQFKEIEQLFLQNYFDQQTLGDIKNSKQKQKDIIGKITNVLEELDKLKKEVNFLKNNQSDFDFFNFEGIRSSLEQIGKELVGEERELRKLSCRIADYSNVNVVEKFSELLQNTFILKKSYSSSKFVHYFEWGSKNIHFFDVDKMVSHKVNLKNDFNIPKFCRTVVTDEGRVFCIGGRHQDNVCCDWMMEYVDQK